MVVTALLLPLATVLPGLRGAARPFVDGAVETLDADGGFRLHFARDGADAVPPNDLDGNGLPDAVDTVRDTLGAARTAYAGDGWRPLVDDDGGGGSGAIDVYLRSLDVYGYATPVPTADGPSCYLQLDPANSVAGQVMASVVWHELHHCVQFRYTTGAASWLYESGATFQQYRRVSDVVLDYAAGLLWAEWLQGHHRPLSAVDGRHEYAAFVFTKFWSERGGSDPDRLLRLWEGLAAPPPAAEGLADWVGALDLAGREAWGEDLEAVYLEHATWSAFACASDDGGHYDPEVIPCIAQATVDAPPFADGERVAHLADPFTAAFRTLGAGEATETGALRVTCRGPGRTRLVARGADGARGESADGDDVQILVPDGGDALLVLTGARDQPLSRTCTLAAPQAPSASGRSAGCDHAGADLSAALLSIAGLAARTRRRVATRAG